MNGEGLNGLKVAMYEVPRRPLPEREKRVTEFSYLGHATSMQVPAYLPYQELIKLVNSESEMIFGREKGDDWVIVIHHPNSEHPFCEYGRSASYTHDIVP